jgi:hypothetical protein
MCRMHHTQSYVSRPLQDQRSRMEVNAYIKKTFDCVLVRCKVNFVVVPRLGPVVPQVTFLCCSGLICVVGCDQHNQGMRANVLVSPSPGH